MGIGRAVPVLRQQWQEVEPAEHRNEPQEALPAALVDVVKAPCRDAQGRNQQENPCDLQGGVPGKPGDDILALPAHGEVEQQGRDLDGETEKVETPGLDRRRAATKGRASAESGENVSHGVCGGGKRGV